MHRTRGGRRIGRYLAALAGTAVIAAGLLVPATAASAGIISIGVAGIDLTSVLGGPGSFGWSTSGATPVSTTQVAKVIGATSTAATGLDGTGVGVALIDTGVVPVPGLPAAQIVNGPDLSFESQAPDLRYLDTFGHGTHLAGIIVGNDPATGFRGIAPGAKLTSVKVGTAQGVVDVSQVIAALDWVVAHRNDDPRNPIRVINLSFGTDSAQDRRSDPLAFAVENAWRAGIVVVVAGGNAGSGRNRLDNPAADPYVLAVGSAGGTGTTSKDDDHVSSFDSVSTGRTIDLVAPGESIISLRDPGSNIDTTYPKARVGTAQFKGSGSSQATAVTSGAVALLLQKRPDLRPDEVKALLTATATPVAGNNGGWVGELNLAAALPRVTPTRTQAVPPGTGTGALDQSRGSNRVILNALALVGEFDIFGPFSSAQWAAGSSAGTAWAGGRWLGRQMAGDGWTGASWASRTWASATWPAGFWGTVWTDDNWSGHYWSGDSWSGHYWSGHYWSSADW